MPTLDFIWKATTTQPSDLQIAFDHRKKELVVLDGHQYKSMTTEHLDADLGACVKAINDTKQINIKSYAALKECQGSLELLNGRVGQHNASWYTTFFPFKRLNLISTDKPRTITFYQDSLTSDQEHFFELAVTMIKNNANITELDFTHTTLNPAMLQKLANSLTTNNRLLSLKLPYCDSSLVGICHVLKTHPTIEILSFSGNNLSGKKILPICDLLRANHRIRSLDLSSTSLDPLSAFHLREALGIDHGLEHLILYTNNLYASGAQQVAEILNCNPKLRALDMGSNSIDFHNYSEKSMEGIIAVAQAIRNHGGLESIGFYWNNFERPALELLSAAFKHNKSLHRIDLAAGKISPNTDLYFLLKDSLTNHPTLRSIRYSASAPFIDNTIIGTILCKTTPPQTFTQAGEKNKDILTHLTLLKFPVENPMGTLINFI